MLLLLLLTRYIITHEAKLAKVNFVQFASQIVFLLLLFPQSSLIQSSILFIVVHLTKKRSARLFILSRDYVITWNLKFLDYSYNLISEMSVKKQKAGFYKSWITLKVEERSQNKKNVV